MAKEKQNTHKVLSLLFILSLATSLFAVYEIYLFSGIETFIRYIIMGVILLYDVRLVFKYFKLRKSKSKKSWLFILWLILYIIICCGIKKNDAVDLQLE